MFTLAKSLWLTGLCILAFLNAFLLNINPSWYPLFFGMLLNVALPIWSVMIVLYKSTLVDRP